MFVTVFKTLLLPPALQILLILVSWVLWRRYYFLSRLCLFLGVVSLWGLSLPVTSAWLHQYLEQPYINQVSDQQVKAPKGADVIVVLGAGRHYQAPEYGGGDTISHQALWRLRFAGKLAKTLELPLVVSGGSVLPFEKHSEAEIASEFLRNELGVAKVLIEPNSRTTWENAQQTKLLLEQKGFKRALLVTHAYHMKRAVYAFDRAGIENIPMPTGFLGNQAKVDWLGDWLPRAESLKRSSLALHEHLGLLFYRFK